MIIAIDGPAASGKGTLARRLAARYGLRHLDTGLTYRAVAAAMLESGADLADEAAARSHAERIDLAALDAEALSDHTIGEAASRIAVMPAVRAILVERQQAFAAIAPGAVLDGRDIGTVVCPQAQVKFFVTAGPQERARRRYEEIRAKGGQAEYADILADIRRRDARDTARSASPLARAADAHLLDTSELDIEAALSKAVEIVESVLEA
jgi:CMP/dCMP kinase